MNYNNDDYIEDHKEQEYLEGNPEPNRDLPRPYKEKKHANDMQIERKELKGRAIERGHAGSKLHPRG